MTYSGEILDLLRLTLVPGLGPIRIGALLAHFGTARRAIDASPSELAQVRGIGDVVARRAAEALKTIDAELDRELKLAENLGVRLVAKGTPEYPALLAELPDAPPLLYVRGVLVPQRDQYPVAIVGSRKCTSYGLEQAERFAGVLAQGGLTIVSGGARGIDSAAHRGAVRALGRTIAVLGSGLGNVYPPENAPLYDEIVEKGGAVISELPMLTSPDASNFPARNRIVSGISLGVIVIEAGDKSGALITARIAAEDHGREVMVVPGRVDSAASKGGLDLLKAGGGAMVTEPGDVIALLESAARHRHAGTHADRFPASAVISEPRVAAASGPASLFEVASHSAKGQSQGRDSRKSSAGPAFGSDPTRAAIWSALDEPRTFEDLARRTGVDPGQLRSAITLLEIERRVTRKGSFLERNR